MLEFTVLHLFAGLGGGALGFQEARDEYRGIVGRFRTLVGIDVDPDACSDFEALTGAPAVQMDLFSRADYVAFHGHQPPADWCEAIPGDISDATGGEYPDVVFLSPPCKGFSGLLPKAAAQSAKYQALNHLVIRGLQLTLDAFSEDRPGLILIENVPRITSRGKGLLKQVKQLLSRHGYVFHEGYHDCGEIGGLAQHRRRYLLIARNEAKVPNFVYKPTQRRVRAIGEVIGPLPMPDDPAAGPMHRLPRLQWKTWVRLALIPAGGDWRDLSDGADYRLVHTPRSGVYQVARWDETANTVVGSARVGGSNGVAAVADPRLEERDGRHPAVYQVQMWGEAGPCVTGTRFGSGAPAISDPRVTGGYSNKHQLLAWDEAATTVTGTPDIQSGAQSIADPRIGSKSRPSLLGVADWGNPISTVIGSASVSSSNGVAAVADPRTPHFNHVERVTKWEDTAGCVTGANRPSNGAISVADPRIGSSPRSGTMGVQEWDKPGVTVIGAGDIHAGSAAIADPRIPADNDRPDPAPIIIALDGTWHRPLTTLELAALQGFPLAMPDGSPLVLAGKSDARWRERIGNAVPPPAAGSIAVQMLMSLMASAAGELTLGSTGIWVVPRSSEGLREEAANEAAQL